MAARLNCPLMDLKSMRNLASMGLRQVKEIEQHISTGNCPHPPLNELFFKGALEGTTPLLLACHYGKLDSVKHIVESWKVDVNSAAALFSDPMNDFIFFRPKNAVMPQIEKATPLLVAAGNGHYEIVRYLVQNGADIFAKSSNKANLKYDGLTPLYGAVCDLRSLKGKEPRYQKSKERATTVRYLLELGADPSDLPSDGYPIWMMSMCGMRCGMDVLKELLNHGIDFNQRHPIYGWTILHHWAHLPGYCTEKDSLAAVNLLLEKGADALLHVQDSEGLTPLLESVKILEMLSLGDSKARATFSVLDLLLEREDIFPIEKIEAMELAGAFILSSAYYAPYYQKAFEYWRRAQQLRQLESNGFGPIIKTPVKLKSGLITEWITSAELEEVIQNPDKYEMQSFLVQFRILSSKKWRAVDHLIYQAVNCGGCCRKLKEQNRFAELFDILWAILEVIRRFDPLEPGLWEVTEKIVEYLVWILSDIMERSDPFNVINTIETSLELILATDQPQKSNADNNMETLLKLISLFAIRPQLVNENVKDILTELVIRDRRVTEHHYRTLLHMACKDERNVHQFAIVHLLLEVGADLDAGDEKGNGPLHVAARSDNDLIAELLLDFGAHLDRVNQKGQTAADVWLEHNAGYDGCSLKDFREEDGSWSEELPDWCREVVPKLSCQSAKVIRSKNVSFLTKLPPSLCSFVKMH